MSIIGKQEAPDTYLQFCMTHTSTYDCTSWKRKYLFYRIPSNYWTSRSRNLRRKEHEATVFVAKYKLNFNLSISKDS